MLDSGGVDHKYRPVGIDEQAVRTPTLGLTAPVAVSVRGGLTSVYFLTDLRIQTVEKTLFRVHHRRSRKLYKLPRMGYSMKNGCAPIEHFLTARPGVASP